MEPVKRTRKTPPSEPRRAGSGQALLLGVGLDATDGHKRITKARDALIVGGSQETHEQMRESVVRFNEELTRRGKRLAEVTHREELIEIAHKAGMIRD